MAGSTTSSSVELSCLAMGVVIHVLGLSLAWVAPRSALELALSREVAPPPPVEVELVAVRPLPVERDLAPGAVRLPRDESPRTAEQRMVVAPAPALVVTPDDEPSTSPDAPDDGWSLVVPDADAPPPAPGALPFGLMGGPVYAGSLPLAPDSAAPAPTTIPKRKVDRDIATKILTADQKRRDKALGLDLPAAGSVAAAVKSAVLSSSLPGVASASIAVELSSDGRARAVRILSSNGGSSSAWAAIGSSVTAILAGQAFPMTGAFTRGALVVVHVQSRMQMPSGPGDGASEGVSFDLADIGAREKRVVTATFSTSPLEG